MIFERFFITIRSLCFSETLQKLFYRYSEYFFHFLIFFFQFVPSIFSTRVFKNFYSNIRLFITGLDIFRVHKFQLYSFQARYIHLKYIYFRYIYIFDEHTFLVHIFQSHKFQIQHLNQMYPLKTIKYRKTGKNIHKKFCLPHLDPFLKTEPERITNVRYESFALKLIPHHLIQQRYHSVKCRNFT